MSKPTYTTKENTKGQHPRLLNFQPNNGLSTDSWAFQPATGPSKRLLGLATDYWLFNRLLGFSSDDWALHPTTGLLSEYRVFYPNPKKSTQFRPMYFHKPFPTESWAIVNGILPYKSSHRTDMPHGPWGSRSLAEELSKVLQLGINTIQVENPMKSK